MIHLTSKASYFDHTGNLLESLNTLPFFHVIKYKIPIFMYEVYYKIIPLTTLVLFAHYYSYYVTSLSFTFFQLQWHK